MGTLIASLGSLPPTVWYDAAAVTFGIVLGIMALLRRRLRWVGAAVLIVTVATALYVTYHEAALAALVTWMPAFVALLVGFLLVARGYHNKAWEKMDDVPHPIRPALPEPAEKTGRLKGKLDLHIRDRIRRNLAGEDLRNAIEEPVSVPTLIPSPPEPVAPIFPVPEPTALASAAQFGPESSDDSAQGGSDAVPSDVLGVWAHEPAQWDERILHYQVVNLAAKFLSPDAIDIALSANTEVLADLAQSIVNYLSDVAPEYLMSAPVAPVPESWVEPMEATKVPDSGFAASLDGTSDVETSGPNQPLDGVDATGDQPHGADLQDIPVGAAAATGVDDLVDHAVTILAQKLGDAVHSFGQDLRLGLAATKSGN